MSEAFTSRAGVLAIHPVSEAKASLQASRSFLMIS